MRVASARLGGYVDSGTHVWYTMLNAMIGWGLAYAFGYAVSRKLSGIPIFKIYGFLRDVTDGRFRVFQFRTAFVC